MKLAGLALALGCLGAAPGHAADRKIVILQALTGVGASYGTSAAAGMKFAADEINATHFMGQDTLKYVVEDDASDRTQSVTMVTRYAAEPDVLAIVGPTIAPTAMAVGPIANEQKISTIVLANSLAFLATGPYAFTSSQPPEVTVPLLAGFAADKVKVKKCVTVFQSDNDTMVVQNRLFKAAIEAKGVKIIDEIGVASNQTDFGAMSTRAVGDNPDCVVLFSSSTTAGNVIRQIKEAGLDPSVKVLGNSGLAAPDLVRLGGGAVEGVTFFADWAPGGAFPRAQTFAKEFKEKTGQDPDNFSAMGDSIMYVLADAIKKAGPNPTRQSVRDQLASSKDVPVVMGVGTFSRDANRVPHTGNVFLTVKNGKFVPYQ
jgi:branched-chain amino acid transport system substrate-binding protein